MSGIVGFVDLPPRRTDEGLAAIVRGMARQLVHRGPDDEGTLVDAEKGLAFGFRRLAIQDLSGNGRQPMTSQNGRYVIVYNGETYNFREIKEDLVRSGMRFWRGSSDTEVLLAAISRIGVAGLLGRCDGMFAFALWDRQAGRLHLVRDRMGEKPLYYGWAGATLMFGSELKALTEHPAWIGAIDRTAVSAFMRYGYIPAPMSIYAGIVKLPAGHWVSFDLENLVPGELPPPRAYWDARAVAERAAAEPFADGPDAAAQELERLLTRSVTQRMVADVQVGAFLRGGVASSLIAALMQTASHGAIPTFAVGFGDDDLAGTALAVARHLGTDHTDIRIEPDTLPAVAGRLARVYDEPFADVDAVAALLLADVVRRHVTAVLSDDGADVLFGGDPRYPIIAGTWAWQSRLSAISRRSARLAARAHGPLRLLNAFSSAGDRLLRLLSAAGDRSPEQLLARTRARWRVVDPPAAPFEGGVFADESGWPDLADDQAQLMFADAVTYLPDSLLIRADRSSMAVGLEVRAPLLGREVVEFAWSVPVGCRVGADETISVLRRLASRYLPPALLEATKPVPAPPIGDWLRGPLRDWAEALLQPDALATDGLLRPKPVLAAWHAHCRGGQDRSVDLWTVLMFQAWRAAWR